VGDGPDNEFGVAAVNAGQYVVEADRDRTGDARGQEEHAPFTAAGRKLVGVKGGDRGVPVDAGQQGDAVANAARAS
jgi:hypothetical protein